jgi:hypothetical protein
MSKSQAIAAVTAVLAHSVGQSANADVHVSRPQAPDAPDNAARAVNIYLYQVTPNAAWRNEDLPTRDSDGNLKTRPQVALDLHYLLSFYGDETLLEPQLMLGAVMRDLHAAPSFSPQRIAAASQDTGNDTFKKIIADSELGQSIERVRFAPATLSLDELSKVWSIFFQIPYALSVAYQATVVLIEKDEPTQTALPVRERRVFAMPLARPMIARITVKQEVSNPDQIIKVGATLLIQGTDLAAQETMVLVDGMKVDVQSISGTEITFIVPSEFIAEDETHLPLRAGSHTLQIVHGLLLDGLSSSEPHRIIESSPVSFLLRPTMQVDSVSDKVRDAQNLFSANITLVFSPNVAKAQRVWMVLRESSASAGQPPRAYRFMAPKDNGVAGDDEDTAKITFSVKDVRAGTYLIQAHVDGSDSPPVELEEFA